jgi:hypothetical protein
MSLQNEKVLCFCSARCCHREISAGTHEKVARRSFPQSRQSVALQRKTYTELGIVVLRSTVNQVASVLWQSRRCGDVCGYLCAADVVVASQRATREEVRVDCQPSKAAAYGVFPRDVRLDQIVSSLNAAGFETASIGVFLPPSHPVANEVRNAKASGGDLSGEHEYDRVVAWLATLGGVVIPDVGFFVGASGYLHAVACGICRPRDKRGGALGIPLADLMRYEARTRDDASLVFVSCDGWAQSEWAREILRLLGAEEVCVLGGREQLECDPTPVRSNVIMFRET